jgi:hypothetical protein
VSTPQQKPLGGYGEDAQKRAGDNGGYLRIAADQRWLQTVIRFQAGQRETLTLRQR